MSAHTIPFHKMEGCGNDFVVVYRADLPTDAGPGLAVEMCDRRLGVGADGVLVVEPARGDLLASMTVWNADGSVAEMCGNGLRCVVRRLVEDGHRADDDPSGVRTGAGVVPAELVGDDVRVGIAIPRLLDEEPVEVAGVAGHRVDLGNPHFVVFADHPGTPAQLLDFGPRLEGDPAFPNRTNVERVEVLADGSLGMRVWERGVGETQACGSGACAAAVAAWATGRAAPGSLTVILPGGTVRVDWGGTPDTLVSLTGPARTVFQGHFRRRS